MIRIKRLPDLFTPSAFKIYPTPEGGEPIMEMQKPSVCTFRPITPPIIREAYRRPSLTSGVGRGLPEAIEGIQIAQKRRKPPGFVEVPANHGVTTVPYWEVPGYIPQNPANVPMEESDPITSGIPEPPDYTKDPSYRPSPESIDDIFRDVEREKIATTPVTAKTVATTKNLVGYGIIGTIIWSILA